MNDAQAFIDMILPEIVGKTIASAIKDEDGKHWGFIAKGDGEQKQVWVLCDPEGNGPGFLDVCHSEQIEDSAEDKLSGAAPELATALRAFLDEISKRNQCQFWGKEFKQALTALEKAGIKTPYGVQ